MWKIVLCCTFLAGWMLASTGCAHVNHRARHSPGPMSLSANIGRDYDKVGEFHDSRKKVFFLWHLIPASGFNGGEIAEDNLEQSDGVVNLSINTSYDVLDFLVSLFTVGLVSTMDVDVHGDLIKLRGAPIVTVPPAQTNINIQ